MRMRTRTHAWLRFERSHSSSKRFPGYAVYRRDTGDYIGHVWKISHNTWGAEARQPWKRGGTHPSRSAAGFALLDLVLPDGVKLKEGA